MGESGLEEPIKVRRDDHLHEAVSDEAGYCVMRPSRNLQTLVSILLCWLEVRREQVPAVPRGRRQFLKHMGVVEFAVGALPIPSNRIVASILPVECS